MVAACPYPTQPSPISSSNKGFFQLISSNMWAINQHLGCHNPTQPNYFEQTDKGDRRDRLFTRHGGRDAVKEGRQAGSTS